MSNENEPVPGVSRRRVLQIGAVTVASTGMTGVATAGGGGRITKQISNVMGPELVLADDPDNLTDCEELDARPVYEGDGAAIRRNPNSISANVSIDTPEPGTYCYAEGDTAVAEEGPPEAFSLWLFTFPEGGGKPFGGAFFVAGHIVGGPNLNLSGQISTETEPFVGDPLDDFDVEVHLAVAPHGALEPDILPEQIQTPAGSPAHWWVSLFDEVNGS